MLFDFHLAEHVAGLGVGFIGLAIVVLFEGEGDGVLFIVGGRAVYLDD